MTGSSRRRAGLRKGRLAVLGALTATALMAFGAGSARAAVVPFSATFDDAALNVGATFDILDPPDTAQFTTPGATIDDASGAFAGTAGQFRLPAVQAGMRCQVFRSRWPSRHLRQLPGTSTWLPAP